MRFNSVEDWLAFQESLNNQEIDLGLERVEDVYRRLGIDVSSATVITVAGTNGKGSCVALLTAMLVSAGYRVGTYTSPHINRYHERIAINACPVDDQILCHAFEQVDQARGDIPLTYFEFGTLAALVIFAQTPLDVVVLEVGLGGRLDAVNIIGADVALITNIDIDHTDWLGPDRESIGKEKAGILRPGKPLVCGDTNPPQSLLNAVTALQVPAYFIQHDFSYETVDADKWCWRQGPYNNNSHHDGCHSNGFHLRASLPLPVMSGQFQLTNAACVLMVLQLIKDRLPVSASAINAALTQTRLPGRFQVVPGEVLQVFDVAHNYAAVTEMARNLMQLPGHAKTYAVFAMLKDKDIEHTVTPMFDLVTEWHVGSIGVKRGASADFIAGQLNPQANIYKYATVSDAYNAVLAKAHPGDRIIVFGSFYTVAEALSCMPSASAQ